MNVNKERFLRDLKFAGLSLAAVYGFNKATNYFSISKGYLKSTEEEFFNWRTLKIYYKKTGTGSPILLLHDLNPASSSYVWERIVPTLAKKHKVYVMDLPGCGLSDKPRMTYNSFYYVLLINDFINKVICEKTMVVASGLSATPALMACAYEPKCYSGLAFINPPSTVQMADLPDGSSEILKCLLEAPLVGELLYNTIYSRFMLDNTLTERYFYNPFNIDGKLLDVFCEGAHLKNSNGRYLEASINGKYLNMDITHALRNLTTPSIVMAGGKKPHETAVAKTWIRENKRIRFRIISKARSYPQIENPRETCQELESFYDERVRRR